MIYQVGFPMTDSNVNRLVAEYGWEQVLAALQEEAARQLVLFGDPTARKVFDVLQACLGRTQG